MTQDLAKLESVTTLAVAFKDAVETKLKADPAMLQHVIQSLQPDELAELQELAMDVASATMMAAFKGVTEELMDLNLKLVDKAGVLATRALSKDELVALVPDDLKNDESADLLAAHHAPNLAALCRPEQP
jgi:hypothetical protein